MFALIEVIIVVSSFFILTIINCECSTNTITVDQYPTRQGEGRNMYTHWVVAGGKEGGGRGWLTVALVYWLLGGWGTQLG